MPFSDRHDAGRQLAAQLTGFRGSNIVVLGLPRGGVPVAFEVARSLDAPLDVIVVRKLGVPFQPELAMGAVGEDGARVLNEDVISSAGISAKELAKVEDAERAEVHRRARRFRGERPRQPLDGRTALIIDDGIATGATARAACAVARAHGAARVVLAVPVAPPSVIRELRRAGQDVVCVESPELLRAIGQWYGDFTQTTDEEVVALLDKAATQFGGDGASTGSGPPVGVEEVDLALGAVHLTGELAIPDQASGLVVFAHGSGSSRHSPRNQLVARRLQRAGLGTLLFDLLTAEEGMDRANVFDIELLAGRLTGVREWLRMQSPTRGQAVGYFGASTGAGAALWAAGDPAADVAAVGSRGGRPDLAGPRLAHVRAPTLLIVGSRDTVVLDLNRDAQAKLCAENRLAVVPGATHLFEEPGTLEAAADLARDWFVAHLTQHQPAGAATG